MAGISSNGPASTDHYGVQFPEGLEAVSCSANSRGYAAGSGLGAAEANIYERQSYRHSGLAFDRVGRRRPVRSETPFLVARIRAGTATPTLCHGRYLDVYEIRRRPGRANERTVVCDRSRIDTLLALPL